MKRGMTIAVKYAFAVAIVVLASLVRGWLEEYVGPMPMFITWYPAVLLVASTVGGGPGILTTILSALVADYWFITPAGFGIASANDIVAIGIFTGTGIFVSVLAERLRRARWAEAVSVTQEKELALLNMGNIVTLDLDHRVISWSEGNRRLYGFDAQEARGQLTSELLHTQFDQPIERINDELLEKGYWEGEVTRQTKDGTQLSIAILWALRRDESGKGQAILEVSTDITQRNMAQEALRDAKVQLELHVQDRTAELLRLNKMLQMLNACNEILVRATDESAMLHEICQAILTVGGYRMAWVGFAQDGPDKKVVPVACVGIEQGYLVDANITWADDEYGRGPTGTAIRTGTVRVCHDFLTDPRLAPWRQQALKRGYQSSIAMPLFSDGKTMGALTIYASQPAEFDEKIIEMLKPFADDLAFGIAILRTRGALRQVEREVLEATEREQQRIGRDLHDSIQGSLAGMKMMLGVAKRSAGQHAPDLAEQLQQAMNVADDTIKQVRGLSRSLCPMELADGGLAQALERLASITDSLFRIPCTFSYVGDKLINDEKTASQLYYISHEAVNNALKHAKAHKIAIYLQFNGRELDLRVEDDGVGIDETCRPTSSLGLRTMAYRASIIGAKLSIHPGLSGGTIVHCSLPMPTR
jgi:PAS domain S-box-containing protein